MIVIRICMYVYIYIYIYRERERERERSSPDQARPDRCGEASVLLNLTRRPEATLLLYYE